MTLKSTTGSNMTINGKLDVDGDITVTAHDADVDSHKSTIVINQNAEIEANSLSVLNFADLTISGRLITEGDISVEGYNESKKSHITVNSDAIMYTHNDLHIREHGVLTLHPNSITITGGNLEHNGTVGFADVYAGEVDADHAYIIVQGRYTIYSSLFGVEDDDVEYINPGNNPEFYAFKGNELSKVGIYTSPGDENAFNLNHPEGIAGFIIHVLPIELVYFTADEIGGGVRFAWETASELNNDYFTIEYSTDAVEFTELTTIEGAGTTTEPKYYRYTDFSSNCGIVYYRLKQTDFDGKYSYSKIVSVTFAENQISDSYNYFVYPNPAFDRISIGGGDYDGVSFVSANGSVLRREAAAGSHDITRLPKGLNFVIIHTSNGDISERFIKR